MTIKTLSLPCPVCKKEVLMTKEFPFRPFCSSRCKSIDFGDWVFENNKIEGDTASSEEGILPEDFSED